MYFKKRQFFVLKRDCSREQKWQIATSTNNSDGGESLNSELRHNKNILF